MSHLQPNSVLIVIEQDPLDPVRPLRIDGLHDPDIEMLHHAFVRDTIRQALAAGAERVRLYVAEPPRWSDVTAAAGESTSVQTCAPGGWSARVAAALAMPFEPGVKEVLIMGTRTPTVSPAVLGRALKLTTQSDVTLGPTPDGDWYLIGLSHPRAFDPSGVDWNAHQAYAGLTEALTAQQVQWAELDLWYPIDSGEALEIAAREINQYRFDGDPDTARDTELIIERLIAKLS